MQLIRSIGRWTMTALVINTIIGSGVFGLPAELTRLLGRASPFAIISGALGVAIIMACMAEVASQFPEPGGPCHYVRTTFGPFFGIQIGWFHLLSIPFRTSLYTSRSLRSCRTLSSTAIIGRANSTSSSVEVNDAARQIQEVSQLSRLFPRLATLLLIAASFAALPAAAQQHDHAAASTGSSVCTAAGFGKVHHPVKTANPQAQRLFDQAMALDYGFNHGQAEQCFRRAVELDPKMAMAYWGIALVLGTNYNLPVDDQREKLAYENVQKALELSANGPRNERDYIEALARRYTNQPNPDYDRLEAAYHDAMREVYKRYPDDLDAATLFAESGMNLHPWKLYDRNGQAAPGTDEIVAVLQSVLKRDPTHLGANHFYIHAVEASTQPGAALPSAQRLAALAPASGHLVHMPAHIFIRTGDHESGEKTNVAAVRVDDAYFAVAHPQGIYPLMYYTHNLHFIAAENAFLGNYAASLQAAIRAQDHVAPMIRQMNMLDAFYSLPLQIMVRFHRWDEIMALPQPDASQPVTTVAWHYARALAAASSSKLDQARTELAALRAAAPVMAKIPINTQGLHNSEVIPQMMSELVEASLANAQPQPDVAIAHLQRAVSLEDTLDYDEPPDWLAPARESLGAALLKTGKTTEAETVFREDLQRNVRNPRSLFGLAETLQAEGKTAEAGTVRQQFLRAWRKADTKLTLAEF